MNKNDMRNSLLRWSVFGIAGVAVFLLIRHEAIAQEPGILWLCLRDGFSSLAVIILMVQLLRLLYRKGGMNAGKYLLYLLGYLFSPKKERLDNYFDKEVDKDQSGKSLFPGFAVAGVWLAIGLLLTITV